MPASAVSRKRRAVSVVLALLLVTSPGVVAAAATATDEPSCPYALGTRSANVYVQTSAEYRACCRSIYAAAGYRLEEMLEDAEPGPVRPAVVMDIDETVLDNSSFQTFLYVNELEYTPELWSQFEQEGIDEVGMVPGASEFIGRAESLGVAVVYLSNRNERNLDRTVAALAGAGLDTTGIGERIYLKPEGASSDKSPRRDAVAARYNVLMYFGDNLRDFSDVFRPARPSADAPPEEYLAAIEARNRAVEDASCHWGVDWFVLPNPIYGEWEKLTPESPEAIFRHSAMETGEPAE